MEKNFVFIFYGILGGLLRALVGLVKYFEKNKKRSKINWYYLLFSLLVSALVGGVAGFLADNNPKFSFLAGYAGTDFLESLYKIRVRQGLEI